MSRIAIISVDGHVKAPRARYRDYLEQKYLDDFDLWVRAAEEAGFRDAGNLHAEFDPRVQWDLDLRINNLESIGVVAEVLFSNGQPFQLDPFAESSRAANAELTEAGRRCYNRWLADFTAQAPERLRGQMQMSFADVDQTVKDVSWAKETRPRRHCTAGSHSRQHRLLRPTARSGVGRGPGSWSADDMPEVLQTPGVLAIMTRGRPTEARDVDDVGVGRSASAR